MQARTGDSRQYNHVLNSGLQVGCLTAEVQRLAGGTSCQEQPAGWHISAWVRPCVCWPVSSTALAGLRGAPSPYMHSKVVASTAQVEATSSQALQHLACSVAHHIPAVHVCTAWQVRVYIIRCAWSKHHCSADVNHILLCAAASTADMQHTLAPLGAMTGST